MTFAKDSGSCQRANPLAFMLIFSSSEADSSSLLLCELSRVADIPDFTLRPHPSDK
jgi:hypothetical protein